MMAMPLLATAAEEEEEEEVDGRGGPREEKEGSAPLSPSQFSVLRLGGRGGVSEEPLICGGRPWNLRRTCGRFIINH